MTSIPIQDSVIGTLPGEVQSTSAKISKERYYKMNHKKRGPFIIINNHKFNENMGQRERTGSAIDNQNLKKIFEDLKFDVVIHQNKTVSEMQDILKSASKEDYSECDCFAMAIMSHGNSGDIIYGIDGEIQFDSLIKPISKNKVRSLIGKPKLFFVQACRGTEIDDGVTTETNEIQYEEDAKNSEDENNMQRISVEADFLYSFSTAPGYYSFRNKIFGSWYVQALKNVFEEYAQDHDLLYLLTLVNCEVAVKKDRNVPRALLNGKNQVPSFTSMLTKLLKF